MENHNSIIIPDEKILEPKKRIFKKTFHKGLNDDRKRIKH